jgi:hypothetical protein
MTWTSPSRALLYRLLDDLIQKPTPIKEPSSGKSTK